MSGDRLLFVRPADDAGAARLADWGKRLQGFAREPFDDLSVGVNRVAINAVLQRPPRALLWFGHGRRDALTAAGRPMVDSGNVFALAERTVVAVACDAASGLGFEAKRLGVRAFLGFRRVLLWRTADPYPVGDALVTGLCCLIEHGHPVGCAAQRLEDLFQQAADSYYASAQASGQFMPDGSPSEAMLAYMGALTNRDGVVVVGDENATL